MMNHARDSERLTQQAIAIKVLLMYAGRNRMHQELQIRQSEKSNPRAARCDNRNETLRKPKQIDGLALSVRCKPYVLDWGRLITLWLIGTRLEAMAKAIGLVKK